MDDGDAIRLRDRDFATSGNLIDYEEAPADGDKHLEPSKHALRDLQNEKFDPSVKNVQEQKSDASVRQMRILGSRPEAGSAIKSLRHSTDPIRGDYVPSPIPPESNRPPGRADYIPTVTHTDKSRDGCDDNDGDDDDSEGSTGGGIQMLDNEDDMEILEPLAIDD